MPLLKPGESVLGMMHQVLQLNVQTTFYLLVCFLRQLCFSVKLIACGQIAQGVVESMKTIQLPAIASSSPNVQVYDQSLASLKCLYTVKLADNSLIEVSDTHVAVCFF
jgi:hypothetical protein